MTWSYEKTWPEYLADVSEDDFWQSVEELAYAIDGEPREEQLAMIDAFTDQTPAKLSDYECRNEIIWRRWTVLHLLNSLMTAGASARLKRQLLDRPDLLARLGPAFEN